MKGLILGLGFLLAGVVQAETVTRLQAPLHMNYGCSPTAFDANDNVQGYCASYTSRSNGGRGGNSTYTYTAHAVSWDVSGDLLSDTVCGTNVQHAPSLNQWTYVSGYSAANCQLPGSNTGPFTLIGNYWYTIKAYSTDGAYEAASGNAGPVVVAF